MTESARTGGHVFISYIREDAADVDRLQQILERAGLRTWRDTEELWPGQDWRAQIRRAIADDALVFLACFSRSSGSRTTSYQNEELTQAIEQSRLRAADSPWLIPVRLDDCQIPDRDIGGGRTLASIQRADLFGDGYDENAERLVEAIRRLLGYPAVPLPDPPAAAAASRDDDPGPVIRDPSPAIGAQHTQQPFPTANRPDAGAPPVAEAGTAREHPRPRRSRVPGWPRRPAPAATAAAVTIACAVVITVIIALRPDRPAVASVIKLNDPSSSGVRSVAFSHGGRIVAAGDANGTTYIWNVNSRKITMRLADPATGGVKSVAFSPDGSTLAAGDLNGRTYLWRLATGKVTMTLPDPGSKGVRSVAFGPGRILAVGDDNGTICLWNLATGKIIGNLHDPASTGVASVAFAPGGTTLAAGDLNDTAYLWDLATRKIIEKLRDPGGGGIYAVAFSPGGAALAAADGDGDAYVWDLAKHRIARTLPDPRAAGDYSVAFGKSGATLATVDGNGTTYLWNLATRKIIHSLPEPPGNGDAHVVFGPSWTTVAIANNDSVYVWKID